ncbi:MAG: hypothetical protein JW940_12725 [Polyangiaceae bacterium]|nr:hypothetical protein [Polyangiaceae bacterium]
MRTMRSGRGAIIALGVAVLLLLGGVVMAQHHYFETTFVAVAPVNGEDLGVVSAWEDFNLGTFLGLLIDYNLAGGTVQLPTNTAAALDTNLWFRPPWMHPSQLWDFIYPTGHLAAAKTLPTTPPQHVIDFYGAWNGDLSWHLSQYCAFRGVQMPTWTTVTASGNPVMAMEVANGFPVAGSALLLTDYVITAETVGGNIAFGAYALTDMWGNLAPPAPVSGRVTALTGSVLGMAISNGMLNPLTQERTLNEIVFVVQSPPVTGPMIVHTLTFDIRTGAFAPAVNTGGIYATPYDLTNTPQPPGPPPPQYPNGTGSTILGGISIARNNQSAMGFSYTHDVAISTANAANPGGATGVTFIFLPTGAPPTWVTTAGGGPICHIPGADGLPQPPQIPTAYVGVAWAAFGFPLMGGQFPFGWYVVTPGSPYTIRALDANGAFGSNFFYSYPQNATPNGPPMAHPGAMALPPQPNPAFRAGTLWIPYVQGGVPAIDFIEGQGTWIGPAAPVSYLVPVNNFPILPPPIWPWPNSPPAILPKGNTVWPANAILRGLAFLSEYGLYIQGY